MSRAIAKPRRLSPPRTKAPMINIEATGRTVVIVLVGPMIGAFIIVFVQNIVSIYVDRWPTLMGLIFVIVVLFARRGLVGAISDIWNRGQEQFSIEAQPT